MSIEARPSAHTPLALASFEEIAQELGKRYPSYALVTSEQVLVDGTTSIERHGYQGNFNVLIGMLASLHDAVITRKRMDASAS